MYDPSATGARLKELREGLRLTQKMIASEMGSSQSAVAQHETGRSELTAKALVWYSQRYHVSTDYLLGLSDRMAYEVKQGNDVVISTAKKPLGDEAEEPPVVKEESFTFSAALPRDRREFEQLVRAIVKECVSDQHTT